LGNLFGGSENKKDTCVDGAKNGGHTGSGNKNITITGGGSGDNGGGTTGSGNDNSNTSGGSDPGGVNTDTCQEGHNDKSHNDKGHNEGLINAKVTIL